MQDINLPQINQGASENQGPQPNAIYQQPMVAGPFVPLPANIYPSDLIAAASALRDHFSLFLNNRQQQGDNSYSGFETLDELKGVFIKQKLELTGAMFGCEPENKYNVYAPDQNGTKPGRKLLKCKEKSNCCARNCLNRSCKPFQMSISTLQRGVEEDSCEPFLALSRPCKCTFFCFNRPFVTVKVVEGERSEYLGKITEPYDYCETELRVYDKDGNHKYTIQQNSCQVGILSHCPFEACETVSFDIKTASGNEVISTIQKRSSGCLKAVGHDKDSFKLAFPDNCSASDKALLLSAALFLDYQHFEASGDEQKH